MQYVASPSTLTSVQLPGGDGVLFTGAGASVATGRLGQGSGVLAPPAAEGTLGLGVGVSTGTGRLGQGSGVLAPPAAEGTLGLGVGVSTGTGRLGKVAIGRPGHGSEVVICPASASVLMLNTTARIQASFMMEIL
jgi:hypothetical protein